MFGPNFAIHQPISGHGCTKKGPFCQNPGFGICSSSGCTVDNTTCFNDKDFCESENTCDEDNGWTWNSDKSDCNIYKCTYDGTLDRTRNTNNADDLYDYTIENSSDYKGAFCWRKNINTPEPDLTKYCNTFYRGSPPPYTLGNKWGNYDCSNWNNTAIPSVVDQSDIVNPAPGQPTYMYPSDDIDYSSLIAPRHITCWRPNPVDSTRNRDRQIHFRVAGASYPNKGSKNTAQCGDS